MVDKNKVEIIEYTDKYKKDVIDFLIQITAQEFCHPEWSKHIEYELLEQYKKGNNNFWIALDTDKRIIGTCGAFQKSDKVIKLNSFYVDSTYRGTGIGKGLYNLLEEFARQKGYETIVLGTYEQFDMGIKFYEKRGFKISKTIGKELWYKKDI